MIYIYQSDSERVREKMPLQGLLDSLPNHLHARALRYKVERDRYNFALGRVLLKQGLEQLGLGDQLDMVSYQDRGKPIHPNVFFNISHSANLVTCALSTKGALGIDVEHVTSVKLEDFRRWITASEWADINEASIPLRRFYWYWTRKESIIKALGVGLSYLHQIALDATQDVFVENGKQWYLRDLDFGREFYGALCSETDEKHIISGDHGPA